MEFWITFIALILFCAAATFLLGRRAALSLAAELLPALVREAEAAFSASGQGKAKLSLVLCRLKEALPPLLSRLPGDARFAAQIEETIKDLRRAGILHPVKEETRDEAA